MNFPKDLVGNQNPAFVPKDYVGFTDTVNHVDVVKCMEGNQRFLNVKFAFFDYLLQNLIQQYLNFMC